MAPFEAQIEEISEMIESINIHVEDGTLSEVQHQIQEQISIHMEMIEDVHVDMAPYLEQIESIQHEMGDLHEHMAEIHVNMEPFQEHMAKIQIEMEPFQEQMEMIHLEIQPFEEEMELLGDRLEKAIDNEVASALRSELGAVTAPGTDFHEAAARITEDANIHIHDDVIRIKASPTDTRDILVDLFSEQRIGTQEAFDRAIDNAVAGLTPMVIAGRLRTQFYSNTNAPASCRGVSFECRESGGSNLAGCAIKFGSRILYWPPVETQTSRKDDSTSFLLAVVSLRVL